MEDSKPKFFSVDLGKVGAIAALWHIFFDKGFSYFFISFGRSPLDTLAYMTGVLIVPILPSFFIARYTSRNDRAKFLSHWIIGTVAMLVLMTVGKLNGENHWW
jgi:hypothetical protein